MKTLESQAPRTRTYTFQPSEDVRALTEAAIDATGIENRSILLNRAVQIGLPIAVDEFLKSVEAKRESALKKIKSLQSTQPKLK